MPDDPLPLGLMERLRRAVRRRPGPFLGNLRRVTPFARGFGYGRGLPIDRHYIESFLAQNALAIRGVVLEVGDDRYSRQFGADRVVRSEVLHVNSGSPGVTIVADLADAGHLESEAYDCILCTQTLQLVFDLKAAFATLHRILRPGGVLLATVPGISQIDDPEWASRWCWSFTPNAVNKLAEAAFGDSFIDTAGHGNVLTSVAFLHGLATEDLSAAELRHGDPAFPLLVTLKAIKSATAVSIPSASGTASPPLASIVIPCFNQGHFLGEAIESALAQTHQPIEVIVVDDGSSDNTSEVAARYTGVRCVQQPNAGLASARNAGLARCSGEYVVFLDADDRLLPDAVGKNLDWLAARPDCAFASGHYRIIDIEGNPQIEWPREKVQGDRYERLLHDNYICMGGTVLFRREVLDELGGFDPTFDACEDHDLYLRVAKRFPVCEHAEVVAEYRRHGQGTTDDPIRMLRGALRALSVQKRVVRGHPRRHAAWLAGRSHLQSYYLKAAIGKLRDGRPLRQRGVSTAFAEVMSLTKAAPSQFVRIVRLVAASD